MVAARGSMHLQLIKHNTRNGHDPNTVASVADLNWR